VSTLLFLYQTPPYGTSLESGTYLGLEDVDIGIRLVGPRKEKLEGEAKHYETTTMPQTLHSRMQMQPQRPAGHTYRWTQLTNHGMMAKQCQ
jgi:hypothetical protein